jgi:hypothetical protein
VGFQEEQGVWEEDLEAMGPYSSIVSNIRGTHYLHSSNFHGLWGLNLSRDLSRLAKEGIQHEKFTLKLLEFLIFLYDLMGHKFHFALHTPKLIGCKSQCLSILQSHHKQVLQHLFFPQQLNWSILD